jgi:hypothetical protein
VSLLLNHSRTHNLLFLWLSQDESIIYFFYVFNFIHQQFKNTFQTVFNSSTFMFTQHRQHCWPSFLVTRLKCVQTYWHEHLQSESSFQYTGSNTRPSTRPV